MKTREDILRMLNKAKAVYVCLRDLGGDLVFVKVCPDDVREKAEEIARRGLSVEFGPRECSDTLYIEAAERG